MSVHMIYYKDGAKMMRPILTAAEYRNLRNGQRSLVAAIRQGEGKHPTEHKRWHGHRLDPFPASP